MKKIFCFAIALLCLSLCFATPFTASELSCPSPQNVTKVGETSSSISFDWDDSVGSSFRVYFVKDGRASTTYQTSSSNYTFTNLQAGEYEFHFLTDCGGTFSTEIIIIDVVQQ